MKNSKSREFSRFDQGRVPHPFRAFLRKGWETTNPMARKRVCLDGQSCRLFPHYVHNDPQKLSL